MKTFEKWIKEKETADGTTYCHKSLLASAYAGGIESAEKEIETLRAEVKALKELDNPEWDGTDAAHPAWWRGHEYTANRFAALVRLWLDGGGYNGGKMHEDWQSIKDEIKELRAENLRLAKVLQTVPTIAAVLHTYWDCDEDSKVGKGLAALSGYLRGYTKEIDELQSVIDEINIDRLMNGVAPEKKDE